MGNTPGQIRAAARSSNADNEKLAMDTLNTLGVVAREKMKNFQLKVVSNDSSHEVPVDKVLFNNQLICCSVSENDTKLKDTVKELVGNITTGKWIDAIVTGANGVLDALFGGMVGSEAEHTLYRIVVGPFGGIRRLDVNMYMFQFTSEAVLAITKNILVLSVVVSSVDPQVLDIPTLRVAIEDAYGEDLDTGRRLFDDVVAEWNAEKKMAITGVMPKRYQLPPTLLPSAQPDDETVVTSPAPLQDQPRPKKRRQEESSKNNDIRKPVVN